MRGPLKRVGESCPAIVVPSYDEDIWLLRPSGDGRGGVIGVKCEAVVIPG